MPGHPGAPHPGSGIQFFPQSLSGIFAPIDIDIADTDALIFGIAGNLGTGDSEAAVVADLGTANVPMAVSETVSGVENVTSLGVVLVGLETAAVFETMAGVVPLAAVELGGLAEQPSPDGSALVAEGIGLDDSAVAQLGSPSGLAGTDAESGIVSELALAFITDSALSDSEAVGLDELVIEPAPLLPPPAAPPIFGGGLGRKAPLQPAKVRRLARPMVVREQATMAELAIAETQWVSRPWSPDQDEEEALLMTLLLA